MSRAMLFILAAINVSFAFCCGKAWEVSRNSLARHGDWEAAKSQLALGAPFSDIMLHAPQAVARGSLNLGAWSGDHELLLKPPMRPDRVSFAFRLPDETYCAFLFNVRPNKLEGFLISSDPEMPGGFFEADAGMRFTRKQIVPAASIKAGPATREVQLDFKEDAVRARIDGVPVGDFATTSTLPQTLGFRGGDRDALIERLQIDQVSGSPIKIKFSGGGLFLFGAALSLLFLTFAEILVFVRFCAAGRPARHGHFLLLLLAPFLLAIAVAAWRFAYMHAAYYDRDFNIKHQIRDIIHDPYVIARLQEVENLYAKKPKTPGTVRVMLVGSSQIYGVGAAREEDRASSRLQAILDREAAKGTSAGKRFEVLNVGVTALHSYELFDLFKRSWIAFNPDVVIVNLGNNDQYTFGLTDSDGERYRTALRSFADLCRAGGIRAIFSLEANSPERSTKLDAQYAIMRSVAKEEKVRLLDSNAMLREHFAEGFLWQDYVHLSSFGQDLLAQYFAVAVLDGKGNGENATGIGSLANQ